MADKTTLAIAIIALIVGAAGLAVSATLSSGVNALTAEQKTLQGLDERLRQVSSDVQSLKQQIGQTTTPPVSEEELLIEAAKKEKTLVMYGPWDAPDVANVIWPRFKQTYPWAGDIQYVEGFATLLQRFIDEIKAGVPSADAQVASVGGLLLAQREGVFAAFPQMKYAPLYPEAFSDAKREWFPLQANAAVLIFNSDLVKPEDAPKSWMDLCDAKWKGQIASADPLQGSTGLTYLSNLQPALGEANWRRLMTCIFIENKAARLGTGGTETYVPTLAGEYQVATSLINDVLKQKPGTPIAIASTKEGVPMAVSGIGINKNAQHPNMARLFVQWMASPEGQKALGATGRPPALLTVESPAALSNALPAGIGPMPLNTDFLLDSNKWLNIFKQILPA